MQLRTTFLMVTVVTLFSTAGLTGVILTAFYAGHSNGAAEQQGRVEGLEQGRRDGVQLGAKAQQQCEAAKTSDANPQNVEIGGAGEFSCAHLGQTLGKVRVHPPEFKPYEPEGK